MVKQHGLKALAVTFDQFDQTPVGENNLKILKEIGVDHVHFTLNPRVVKTLVLRGLRRWVIYIGLIMLEYSVFRLGLQHG